MCRFLGLRARFRAGLPRKAYSPNGPALPIATNALTRRPPAPSNTSETELPYHTYSLPPSPTPSPTKS
jgi:hypothetical protein